MKKKSVALLSSCAAIAICSSLIVGSTYALFTSESQVNIAVTSAKVNVEANIGDIKTTSTLSDWESNGAFELGGSVSVDGNVINIDKIAPGDKVEIPVTITNNSNIDVLYRTKVVCTEGYELMSGLKVTVNGNDFSSIASYTSAYTKLSSEATVDNVLISIELPDQSGDAYQELTTNIAYIVEAVQANAGVEGDGEIINKISVVSNESGLTDALSAGGVVLFSDDINLTNVADTVISENTVLELGGHSLTTAKGSSFTVKNGGVLSINNGDLNMSREQVTLSAIYVEEDSTLNIDGVEMNTNSYGIYASGPLSNINVKDSSITSGAACISTNAETDNNGNVIVHDVIINVEDSTLNGMTGMLINVPCTVNVTGCTIEATFQGIVARGGNITIKDSTISNTNTDGKYLNTFDNQNWGTGNTVNLAALTIGNKGTGYQYPMTVKLINTTIESVLYPTVYMYGNTSEGNGATLYYDSNCVVGNVIQGDNGANTFVNP